MSNEPNRKTPVQYAVALSPSLQPSKTMTISAVPEREKTISTDFVESAIADSFVSYATAITSRP